MRASNFQLRSITSICLQLHQAVPRSVEQPSVYSESEQLADTVDPTALPLGNVIVTEIQEELTATHGEETVVSGRSEPAPAGCVGCSGRGGHIV